MIYQLLIAFFSLILFSACSPSKGEEPKAPIQQEPDSLPPEQEQVLEAPPIDTFAWADLPDTTLVPVEALIPNAVLEIRYATENNFMELQIYDCPACYLRLGVAKALRKVQARLAEKGYSLLLFDCYRPQSAQYKLWKKTPDPRYVADPRKGSVHSRGAAVDLSIVDSLGRELDMGTPFDYFGKEAYWAYTKLSTEILANRKLLKDALLAEGFNAITTEWWHFNYGKGRYALSDYRWPCN